MLSHAVKKILDDATGLSFSPIIGMSESFPIASYKLSDYSNETINASMLEVRIFGSDYDEIEELREKVKRALAHPTGSPGRIEGGYLIRGKLSGGGILPMEEMAGIDSTQYIMLSWHRIGE